MKISWVTDLAEIPDPVLRAWMVVHTSAPTQELIRNVQTEVRCLSVNEIWFFPVTINDTEWENSYVCSPYTAYVSYAEEELRHKIKHRFLVWLLLPLLKGLGRWFRRVDINKIVHVNNFLLSTNPYPQWNGEGIVEIKDFLLASFPEHSIIFRSINTVHHTHLLQCFEKQDFTNIVSRQVYLLNQDFPTWKKRNTNVQDFRKIRKAGLQFIDHKEMGQYLEEALALYNLLYLEKYSYHNPQFTIDWFCASYDQHLLHFQGYTDKNGRLKTFCALFTYNDTVTSPLVGYDTAEPAQMALYIHAMQSTFQYAFAHQKFLNLSSGAPEFKRTRGCSPCLEYMTIYHRHLSSQRQRAFRALAFASNRIGAPLVQWFKL